MFSELDGTFSEPSVFLIYFIILKPCAPIFTSCDSCVCFLTLNDLVDLVHGLQNAVPEMQQNQEVELTDLLLQRLGF